MAPGRFSRERNRFRARVRPVLGELLLRGNTGDQIRERRGIPIVEATLAGPPLAVPRTPGPAPRTAGLRGWNLRQSAQRALAQNAADSERRAAWLWPPEIRREGGRWLSAAPGRGQDAGPPEASRTGVPSADRRHGKQGCPGGRWESRTSRDRQAFYKPAPRVPGPEAPAELQEVQRVLPHCARAAVEPEPGTGRGSRDLSPAGSCSVCVGGVTNDSAAPGNTLGTWPCRVQGAVLWLHPHTQAHRVHTGTHTHTCTQGGTTHTRAPRNCQRTSEEGGRGSERTKHPC